VCIKGYLVCRTILKLINFPQLNGFQTTDDCFSFNVGIYPGNQGVSAGAVSGLHVYKSKAQPNLNLIMKKMSLQPPQLFQSGSYGFSQVVVAPPGRRVFIAGQVAWDVDEQIVGPGDLAMQARQAIANLAHAMAEAGGTLEDVTALR